jgi:SAM-dependent methyltransferase
MNPADNWPIECHDGCGNFFGACLRAGQIDLPVHARVLEIGCAEFDWLKLAARSWPDLQFTGVDWRQEGLQIRSDAGHPHCFAMHGNVLEPKLFRPESFDWIVSISAIEHIGLGHYDSDPKAEDGDTQALTNAWRWLKPGGWLVFDVPYQPDRYEVCGTSHRIYDDHALFMRLWSEPLGRAKTLATWHQGPWYAPSWDPGTLVSKPTYPDSRFHYVGVAWQKC